MVSISNKTRTVVGSCLVLGQLLTANVTLAKTTKIAAASIPTASSQSVYQIKSAPTPDVATSLWFDTPMVGQFQINGTVSYATADLTLSSVASPLNSGYTAKLESSGLESRMNLAYGFNRYFYGKLAASYGKLSQDSSNQSQQYPTANKSTTEEAGFTEPSMSLGVQTLLNSTRLFAELNVEIPVGERTESRSLSGEATNNRLRGGMSYSPRIGVIHDFGDVLLLGGVSYTFREERSVARTNSTRSYTEKVTGGNSLESLAGVEFKNLLRWGVVMGYAQTDAEEVRDTQYNIKTNNSNSLSRVIASTQLGIKVGDSSYLVPRLSYATLLEKELSISDGTKLSIGSYNQWSLDLGARINF